MGITYTSLLLPVPIWGGVSVQGVSDQRAYVIFWIKPVGLVNSIAVPTQEGLSVHITLTSSSSDILTGLDQTTGSCGLWVG